MPSYTVHVPRDEGDAFERAERTAFVRDGFSVWAFLFGPLYLMRCRAWAAAAVWVIVVLGGVALCVFLHVPRDAGAGLWILAMLLTGLEANSLHRDALRRRGLDIADVVEGANREEGERAFFRAATVQGLPPRTTVLAGQLVRPDEPVIGFFPHSGPAP